MRIEIETIVITDGQPVQRFTSKRRIARREVASAVAKHGEGVARHVRRAAKLGKCCQCGGTGDMGVALKTG